MSGSKLLLDSNVCIYLSKEELDATHVIKPDDFVAISIVTYMEVLGYNFEIAKEEQYLINFFETLTILPISNSIANQVIAYRKQKKIKLPDAILLATARENNCKLVTRNIDDFKNLDNKVEIINPFDK